MKQRRSLIAFGGVAMIATEIGAVAVGAFAIGGSALQLLAIRRVLLGSAECKSLAIQELMVKCSAPPELP